MKQIALYFVLFSYCIVMVKPVSPYLKDACEHVFNYTQHMAIVHYENGQYHVHQEVAENEKKEASQKQMPASKKDNSTNDHISIQQKEASTAFLFQSSFTTEPAANLLHNYLAGQYPPPRA